MALEIFQGEDKTIVVTSNIDLTSHTEIEFRIDAPDQIKKTLTGGSISGVTTTEFLVQIDAADTETLKAGPYKFQARATDSSGKISNARFQPNKIEIRDSVFTSAGSGKDYS